MNKKKWLILFFCFSLSSLQSTNMSSSLPSPTAIDKAITFVTQSLGVSMLNFTLAACANVYFASPKEPFKEWIFNEKKLKITKKKMTLGTTITGLCAIGIAIKTNSPILKTAATSAFLGALASLGMIVGFDIVLNTDLE